MREVVPEPSWKAKIPLVTSPFCDGSSKERKRGGVFSSWERGAVVASFGQCYRSLGRACCWGLPLSVVFFVLFRFSPCLTDRKTTTGTPILAWLYSTRMGICDIFGFPCKNNAAPPQQAPGGWWARSSQASPPCSPRDIPPGLVHTCPPPPPRCMAGAQLPGIVVRPLGAGWVWTVEEGRGKWGYMSSIPGCFNFEFFSKRNLRFSAVWGLGFEFCMYVAG